MDNEQKVKVFLVLTGVFIGLAIAMIFVAIGLNTSVFYAIAAAVCMGVAAALTCAAIGFLTAAKSSMTQFALNNIIKGQGEPPCRQDRSNFNNAVNAMLAVLGIQAASCGAAALVAWIPIIGSAPMYPIVVALIVQAGLVPTLYYFSKKFFDCIKENS